MRDVNYWKTSWRRRGDGALDFGYEYDIISKEEYLRIYGTTEESKKKALDMEWELVLREDRKANPHLKPYYNKGE